MGKKKDDVRESNLVRIQRAFSVIANFEFYPIDNRDPVKSI